MYSTSGLTQLGIKVKSTELLLLKEKKIKKEALFDLRPLEYGKIKVHIET